MWVLEPAGQQKPLIVELAHKSQEFFGRNLAYDFAGLAINNLNNGNLGFFINTKFKLQSEAIHNWPDRSLR